MGSTQVWKLPAEKERKTFFPIHNHKALQDKISSLINQNTSFTYKSALDFKRENSSQAWSSGPQTPETSEIKALKTRDRPLSILSWQQNPLTWHWLLRRHYFLVVAGTLSQLRAVRLLQGECCGLSMVHGAGEGTEGLGFLGFQEPWSHVLSTQV